MTYNSSKVDAVGWRLFVLPLLALQDSVVVASDGNNGDTSNGVTNGQCWEGYF